MNPVVARAVEHFRERQEERFEAVVPEWGDGDEPLVLYATPMTMAERRKIQNINRTASGRIDTFGVTCDIVITKAEDVHGKKVFTRKDKPWFLNKIDPKVTARVADELLGGEEVEPDDDAGLPDLDAGIDDAGKD